VGGGPSLFFWAFETMTEGLRVIRNNDVGGDYAYSNSLLPLAQYLPPASIATALP